jgi:ABC-type multidrug transport system fused ATPase/permease subunit
VLHDVTLAVRAGETVAFVGPRGLGAICIDG